MREFIFGLIVLAKYISQYRSSKKMFLVELGDEAVLAEDLFVVGFGDSNKVVEFGLDLGVPVFVIVQKLWVQVV